ncbi:nucleotide-binding universal stress UspA family protein [Tenacibaculum skagerrakense]|uniref:Nucleotide-binding universal stress UspA family protein n=1 Tax=Tenacibaculum skagerrakense TaxID=186571 RepID=A0A4R2NT59_9FLAO|nr:universal stress protein [Tenacibaculum skagerrakense]TCP25163.1 nucleotide-binding universal stress UspA family protein [Tenacibaculum skagerrakense]
MKKILLPTDFSDNSWNAIQYALALCKDQKCVFNFLHVYTPVIYDAGYFEVGAAQVGFVDVLKKTAEENMEKLMEKVTSLYNNPNHVFSSIVSFNTITNEINELYKGNVIDFVIMGTKGASGLEKVLFGTNTVQVIKNVECPVLAVPDNYKFTGLNEVLFPSDYEVDFQIIDFQYIIDFVTGYQAKVHSLHVSKENLLSKTQESNKDKLQRVFENVNLDFHLKINQSVTEEISNFQSNNKIDLLLMVNNKKDLFEKLFLKSKVKQIGFQVKIPFLVIPA